MSGNLQTRKRKLSFVIPCYGSAQTLRKVVEDLREMLRQMRDYKYEIVLVNDASPDNVLDVIEDLFIEDPEHIIGIDLARNFGQHSALMAGYNEVTGDYVVSLDDDGQTPAAAIPDMLGKLLEGHDVVYASYHQKKHAILRNWGSRLNSYMAEKLLDKPKELYLSSFYVARRFVIDEMLRYHNAYPYLQGLVLRSTHNVANCPVEHHSRATGASGYTLGKLVRLWVNGFTSFSVKPLRLATLCGFLCAVLGFLGIIWVCVGRFVGLRPPLGYSTIMITLLFMGGMLMLMLGMIGEYVGRTFVCLNMAPQYVIRRKYVKHEKKESFPNQENSVEQD